MEVIKLNLNKKEDCFCTLCPKTDAQIALVDLLHDSVILSTVQANCADYKCNIQMYFDLN